MAQNLRFIFVTLEHLPLPMCNREFLHQRVPTPSGPTESHEGGPTYNRSYPTSIEKKFHYQRGPTPSSPTQLPRVRCYITSTKRDTIVQEVLPQYLRSYLTSKKKDTIVQEVIPQYIRCYLDISGPTQPPRGRSYLTSTKKDTIVQEVLPQYIRFYLNISGPNQPPRWRSYLTFTKRDTIIQEINKAYRKLAIKNLRIHSYASESKINKVYRKLAILIYLKDWGEVYFLICLPPPQNL
ncbi:hypothetical protein Fot_11131 [Forsythia ovata]|uniref:Ribosomal protein S10 n=1 Tax=Forsythia ovata TaxID=205694 RepID=A0ABD1WIT6_9LAMI